MKKLLLTFGFILLFSSTLFSQGDGRVVVNITYTQDGIEYTKTLVTYYSKKASVIDASQNMINEMLSQGEVLGESVDDLRSAGLVDNNGRVEATLTYNQDGSPNVFTLQEFYDPEAEAYHNVALQIKTIDREGKLYGESISNLEIGAIEKKEGSYEAVLTYDLGDGASKKTHTIKSFFDPKAEAYYNVALQIKLINERGKINDTSISNLTVGAIEELDGSYKALLTYDVDDDASRREYVIQEYFNPRAMAMDRVQTRINNIKRDGSLNGSDLNSINVAVMENTEGKIEALISYKDADGIGGQYLIEEFYDAKQEAVHEMTQLIEQLKRDGKINGESIDNLKIGQLEVM